MSTKVYYAVVDSQSRAIWARAKEDCPAYVAAKELEIVRRWNEGRPCYLLETTEDAVTAQSIRGRHVEGFVTAQCAHADEQPVTVELWQSKQGLSFDEKYGAKSKEFGAIERQQFELAAEFIAPGSDPLGSTYCLSQNIEHPWNPLRPTRSTDVGDVMVVHQADGRAQAFRVMCEGFAPVAKF